MGDLIKFPKHAHIGYTKRTKVGTRFDNLLPGDLLMSKGPFMKSQLWHVVANGTTGCYVRRFGRFGTEKVISMDADVPLNVWRWTRR